MTLLWHSRWQALLALDLITMATKLAAEHRSDQLSLVDAAQHAWQAGRPDWARTLLTQARTAGADMGRLALLHGEIELRNGDPAVAVHELTTAAAHLADP